MATTSIAANDDRRKAISLITSGSPRRHSPPPARARFLALAGVLVLGAAIALPGSPAAASVVAKVNLGTTDQFGVLAGSTVTNTGNTILNGLDLGVSPGTAVTGFPPGVVITPGTEHLADGVAGQAQLDAKTAYNQAAGLPADNSTAFTELGGKTLLPGVYQGNLSLTGTVTLDNSNNPDAVFVFQASSTLITASSSVVTFKNPDHPSCNVFWQVGSSATLGTDSVFVGTIDALTSISADTSATIQGRLIARKGAVTLDSNVISRVPCATPPPTSTPPTSSSPPTSTPPTKPSTSSTPPTKPSSSSKPPTSSVPTTIPPPHETTTDQTLTISRSSSTNRTTTAATSTRRSTTGGQTSTSTDVLGSRSTQSTYTTQSTYSNGFTDTTAYTDTTGSTGAAGLGSGSGSSGATGRLASTGARVTGLLVAGSLLLFGGVVVLLIAGRRRVQDGRHRPV